jgi:hypothetical protein
MISVARFESGFSRSSNEGIVPKTPQEARMKKKNSGHSVKENAPEFIAVILDVFL